MSMLLLPNQVSAMSAKTKALKAYNKLLSKKTINRGMESWNTSDCKFFVAYIDNNSVPELIVYNYKSAPHAGGFGALYTYKNGKVKYVQSLALNIVDRLGYYKKTGWFMDNGMYTGYGDERIEYFSKGKVRTQSLGYVIEASWDDDSILVSQYTKRLKSGKVVNLTKKQFRKELKKAVKGRKLTKYKFHKNTKSNRKKYLN
jgi:hypothetical protein